MLQVQARCEELPAGFCHVGRCVWKPSLPAEGKKKGQKKYHDDAKEHLEW